MNSFFRLPSLAAIFYILVSLLEKIYFFYYVIGDAEPYFKEINIIFNILLDDVNSLFFTSLCLYFVTIFIFYCHRIYQCTLKNICLLFLITITTKLCEYIFYRTSSISLEFISFFFILISLWFGFFLLLRRFFDTTKEDFPFTTKQIKRIHCHFYCFLYAMFIVAITYFYVLPSNKDGMGANSYPTITIIQFVVCYILLFYITNSLFSEKFSSLQLKRLFKSVGWSACFVYLAQIAAVLIAVLFFVNNNDNLSLPVFIFCIVLIVIFVKINRVAVRRYFGDTTNT